MGHRESAKILMFVWGISFLIIIFSSGAYSEVPQQISYQGYLSTVSGNPVPDGDYLMVFSIYDENDILLWSESQTVTLIKGIYNVLIGQDPINNPFPSNLFDGRRSLGVAVEQDDEMLPRQPLASTPFAMKAQEADKLNGMDSSEFAAAVHTHSGSDISEGIVEDVRIADSIARDSEITWSRLSGIPAGFADGIDNDTVYNAGTGITIGSGNISINLSYTDPRYVNESQAASITSSMIQDGATLAEILDDDGSGSGLDADKLDGLHAASFLNTSNDYGRSGVASSLYEGTDSLESKYINSSGDSMVGSSGSQLFYVKNSSTGHGLLAETYNTADEKAAVKGEAKGTAGNTKGVIGITNSPGSSTGSAVGVYGLSASSYSIGGSTIGVLGRTYSVPQTGADTSVGVFGWGDVSSGRTYGVWGETRSSTTDVSGVYGAAKSTSGRTAGVIGRTDSSTSNAAGVIGSANASAGATYGVWGKTNSADGIGVYGSNDIAGSPTANRFIGVKGKSTNGWGLYGESSYYTALYAKNNSTSWYTAFIESPSSTGPGLYVKGNVYVTGTVSKSGGSFKIDHPLDPGNMYLNHSFVESPDMMNVYNGNVVLDENGEAWVNLPEWFEALNRDFRYQLTPIGAPGPNLYIAQEIDNNQFKISGGDPGLKVSWQVTGIRQDPYAEAHRIPVEEEKPENERGTFLNPELYEQGSGAMLNKPAIQQYLTMKKEEY